MSNSAKMATLILPDNKKVNLPYKEATIGQNVVEYPFVEIGQVSSS